MIAADVYGWPPHTGRGGWTWYTGSASWMYRAALESILGFELRGNKLRLNPQVPQAWDSYEMRYRFGKTLYKIQIVRKSNIDQQRLSLDGSVLSSSEIPLEDDGREHSVLVEFK